MPRGRKKLGTVEEQIEVLKNEIEALKAETKKKQDKLKELEKKKEAEDNKEIMEAVARSGKSKDEILRLISEG